MGDHARGSDYNVGLKGGIFEVHHYKRMGPALWLYGWLILRQTRQEDTFGYVLGGKPISYAEIQGETGFPRKTLERWMHVLRHEGYIETKTVGSGIAIRITNAKKFSRPRQGDSRDTTRSAQLRSQEMGTRLLSSGAGALNSEEQHPDNLNQYKLFDQGISKRFIEDRKYPPHPAYQQNQTGRTDKSTAPHYRGSSPRGTPMRENPGPAFAGDLRWLREELVRRELRVGAAPEVIPARKG